MTKKIRSKSIVLLFGMVLMVCPFQLQAQDYENTQQDEPTYGSLNLDFNVQYGRLPPGELLIINGATDRTIPFYLKNGENGDPVLFKLDPNERRTYINTTHVWINTTNGNSFGWYRLSYQNRYEIYWNNNRWSMKHITPR